MFDFLLTLYVSGKSVRSEHTIATVHWMPDGREV